MKKVKKEIESNVIWGHGLVSILNRVVREGISEMLEIEQKSKYYGAMVA